MAALSAHRPVRVGCISKVPLHRTVRSRVIRYLYKLDYNRVCPQKIDSPVTDKRVLERDVIKRLIRDSENKIDSRGIRIIGAIFCEGLDLSGIDIPYSLVLDKALTTCTSQPECWQSPVEIRNFRTKGDLSFDGAVNYQKFLISRSHVSGSFYASFAFFKNFFYLIRS